MAQTVLNSAQRDIIAALTHDTYFTKNFYLTGGTALAEYYLHHRLSEDLDFFSELEIDKLWLTTLCKKILTSLKLIKYDIQESYNRNLVYFFLKENVTKTEFTYFPFTHIEIPKTFSGITVDSLADIAVNKFFTIYQNPSARHFIDLFLILQTKKFSWDHLEKLCRIKFDTVIDPIQLGSQLVRAQEVKDMPRMIIPLAPDAWRNYFTQKARELGKKLND